MIQYELPEEITNSTCYTLLNKDTIMSFNDGYSTTWTRSGTKWYKSMTTTAVENGGYECMTESPEYEYSWIDVALKGSAFALVGATVILVFWLILLPLLRGSR